MAPLSPTGSFDRYSSGWAEYERSSFCHPRFALGHYLIVHRKSRSKDIKGKVPCGMSEKHFVGICGMPTKCLNSSIWLQNQLQKHWWVRLLKGLILSLWFSTDTSVSYWALSASSGDCSSLTLSSVSHHLPPTARHLMCCLQHEVCSWLREQSSASELWRVFAVFRGSSSQPKSKKHGLQLGASSKWADQIWAFTFGGS